MEEAEAIAKGEVVTVHANVTPSLFVLQGIELEDGMCVCLFFFWFYMLTCHLSRRYVRDLDGLGAHSTDLQRSKLLH
jgi:hypothetical protein